MQQIKIFEGHGNNEVDINDWLKENSNIEITSTNMIPMFDRYNYGQGDICNQWIATIIVYNQGNEGKIEVLDNE